MPTTPHSAAGWRIEPPVSVPSASGAIAAATAAAEPPLEPPGHALEIPGVARRAVGRVLGRRAHRELVHVRLAELDHALRLAAAHDGRRVRRPVALEDARAGRRRHAADAEQILVGDRHAGDAAAPGRVQRARTREHPLGIDVQEHVEIAVRARRCGRGRPRRRPRRSARARRAGARSPPRSCGRRRGRPSGADRGTRKPSAVRSGASSSSCSRGHGSRGTSSPSTFTRSSACEVGGTSARSSDAMRPM